MEEIEIRLKNVEKMFEKIDEFVGLVVKDAKSCKSQLKEHKKEIKNMKKVIQKIYLHNIKILKKCPEAKVIE